MPIHGLVVFLAGLVPPYAIEPPDLLRIDVSGLPKKAQQIQGEHLVRPDGTVSLGTYGTITVVGRTPDQVRAAVAEHLAAKVKKNRKDRLDVRVAVTGYNSKAYYVISADQVHRLPSTNTETVLDAVRQVNGAADLAAKGAVWIARPGPAGRPDQVLPVDWTGIVRDGKTATNYQVLPGDRVFIGDAPRK